MAYPPEFDSARDIGWFGHAKLKLGGRLIAAGLSSGSGTTGQCNRATFLGRLTFPEPDTKS